MNFRFTHCGLAVLLAASLAPAARAELVLPRVSPNAAVHQTIGVTNLSLTYSRPGVKQRVIWGGLVPFDKPWRTGANDATTFTASTDVSVAGQNLPAGTYSFFTIPTAGDWTVIFSKQKNLWGAFAYDPAQDQLRVTVKPEMVDSHQEWMWLGFDDLTPTSGNLVVRWEKLRLAVPITVDVNNRVLANARAELAAAKPDDWRTAYRAASWAFDNGVALEEASGWLDRSIAVQGTYQNLGLRARWLAKEGKTKDALATARKAIAAGKAEKEPPDMSSLEKQMSEWEASQKNAGKSRKG